MVLYFKVDLRFNTMEKVAKTLKNFLNVYSYKGSAVWTKLQYYLNILYRIASLYIGNTALKTIH